MTSSKSVEMSAKKLGQVVAENCVVMVCDLQERFAPSILHFDIVVKNANKIAKCAQLLELPVLATEQYPRGLGATVEPLKTTLNEMGCHPVSKTKFTMLVPDVLSKLEALKSSNDNPVDTVILCGIETHVCIVATCIDLLECGFNVHLVADAVSSRTQTDRKLAIQRMAKIGAHVTTTESIILALVGDASHKQFKSVQQIIKETSPDTGLSHL